MSGLHFDADIDEKKLTAKVNKINSELQDLGKQAANSGSVMDNAFGKAGNSLDKMGLNLSSLIGPAAALAAVLKFKQMAQDAHEFEKEFGMAMREVQTISKAVQNDFEGISQSIVDMSANGPEGAIKLAKAYYQIVSAGYDGAEGLKLLEISSRAATAGITDTTTAADGLTTVMNAWQLSAEKAESVADVMFTTVRLGKTTFGELASNIAQVAPLAASNNVEFEQIFAALSSITKQGTPTAQAMTQIRSSLVNMNKVLGDGWAKTMTYQEGLNKIALKAGGSQNKLKELIPDVEGVNAVLALTGEKAKGAADDLDETAKAAGAMETAYGRMMEEANNKWSMVHNKWMREIRGLGKAMKEESGNLANFMDALLSKGADVDTNMSIYGIADKIKALRVMGGSLVGSYIKGGLMPESVIREQYDQYVKTITEYAKKGLSQQQMSLGDILGITDKDERLTKLNEFLVSIKEAESDIGKTVFQNNEQQSAALKIRAELWGEVEARAKEAIKAIEGTEGVAETKSRTLKVMLEDLKTAQDSIGTGTLKDDIATLARISVLQQEVLAYYDKIREARKIEPAKAIKPISGKESLGGVQSITKEQAKQEFQGDKLLKQSKARTIEAQKQADAIKEQNDRYIKQTALFEQLTNGLHDSGEILSAMSYAIGEFDEDLGQSVGKMADLANNASNMVASFASGNMAGAIASGIGIIGNIIGLTKTEKEDPALKSLIRMNALLEQQSAILSNLAGTNYFQLAEKQYNDLGKSIDLNLAKLRETALLTQEQSDLLNQLNKDFVNAAAHGNNSLARSIQKQIIAVLDAAKQARGDWSADEILDAYAKGEIILNEAQAEWVKSILEAKKQQAELLQGTFRKALGFDASDVSDSIFQGIKDGLKLGENNLGGFAQSFGDLMEKTLMQSVIEGLNIKLTEGFLTKYKAFVSQESDGGKTVTPAEIAELEKEYAAAIVEGTEAVEIMKGFSSKYVTPTASSQLTGISAQLTEDTGSLIAGQFTGMRIDIKSLQETGINMLAAIDLSLSALNNIEKNTRPIYRLEAIEDGIKELNRNIKNLG